ncbi:MAG: intradiol ring-cleavage dioxygenase [Solirubrobacteraceae bacterium]
MAHDNPISRRQALVAAGAAAAGAAVVGSRFLGTANGATSSSQCVLSPELTEGPYYIDENLIRRDITEGKDGLALQLRLTVEDASTCKPIHRATVEVWHADATGNYSGFDGAAAQTTYLRGGQRTNRNGLAIIDTIYPGWYQGRTPHIHLKVHVGGDVVHTGQLFFKTATSEAVYETGAYASHGEPDTTNASDNIYASGGNKSLLRLMKRSGGGYRGAITLGIKR